MVLLVPAVFALLSTLPAVKISSAAVTGVACSIAIAAAVVIEQRGDQPPTATSGNYCEFGVSFAGLFFLYVSAMILTALLTIFALLRAGLNYALRRGED